jgi:hypothetical protein
MTLTAHRCAHHAGREAAARCPSCHRFFCRECVTEHAGRVLCAACLAQRTVTAQKRAWNLSIPLRAGGVIAGLLVCVLVFQLLGRLLLRIPSDWHEGTAWTRRFLDS